MRRDDGRFVGRGGAGCRGGLGEGEERFTGRRRDTRRGGRWNGIAGEVERALQKEDGQNTEKAAVKTTYGILDEMRLFLRLLSPLTLHKRES